MKRMKRAETENAGLKTANAGLKAENARLEAEIKKVRDNNTVLLGLSNNLHF